MTDYSKQLAFIATTEEPKKLRVMITTARNVGADDVAEAATQRLYVLEPQEDPASMEHDFFQTMTALELVLSEERGKLVRLSPTRQRVAREGVAQVLQSLALEDEPDERYTMLLERGLPELTTEAVILRHRDRFSTDAFKAAKERLINSGVSMRDLPTRR